jgi:CheY-like chemotaxis protein
MNLAKQIAPYLPCLRRLARAVTGNQSAGDAHVATLLQSLIAEPQQLRPDAAPAAEYFRLLCRTLRVNVIEYQPGKDAARWERETGKRLEPIPLIPRLAFLLRSVEGFDTQGVAYILEQSPMDVESNIQTFADNLAEQLATDVLIIEDEPLIAMEIEDIVRSLGHRVSGIARTHAEAVASVANARPGLILADIHLADGSSGIDAVNEILSDFDPPVIFITAYPERLLTGDRPEPAFLIAKPFRSEMVAAIIGQALFFNERAHIAGNRPVAARQQSQFTGTRTC